MQQRFADCCVETMIVSAALSVAVRDGTAHAMRKKGKKLCIRAARTYFNAQISCLALLFFIPWSDKLVIFRQVTQHI
jgi:hypothetical protein